MSAIVDGIIWLWDFVSNVIDALYFGFSKFFDFLGNGLSWIDTFTEYMPTELVAISGIVVTVSLVYLILGRL